MRLPDALGFVEAASLGCRFMTAFHALTAQGRVQPGEWVAVHGCGGVGLSAVMIAAALGARVVAVDLDDAKLERARALGAEHVLRSAHPVGAILELTQGGAHVSLDALGSAATLRNSVRCLRKKGRHVQVGLLLGESRPTALPMGEVIAKELELRGSHGMPAHAYPQMLRMIAEGTLAPQRLVGKTLTLEEAGAELAAMGRFAPRGVSVIVL